jgi:hypothetical protein
MDMETTIKNHLEEVYANLTGTPTDFLIPVNFLDEYIKTEDFIKIYNDIIVDKKNRFGYGHKVYTDDFPVFDRIRKRFPKLKNYFYFLKTNRVVKTYPIHIDGPGEFDSKAGINWPLLNCDSDSDTIWYTVDKHEFYYHDIQNSIFLNDDVVATELHKFNFVDKTPYLFRGDVWHTGINRKNQRDFRVMVKWELSVQNWKEAQDALSIS